VEDPVEDGVGHALVGQVLMPGLGGQLAAHDRRALAVTVVEDLSLEPKPPVAFSESSMAMIVTNM
jgi:hypothetical protein